MSGVGPHLFRGLNNESRSFDPLRTLKLMRSQHLAPFERQLPRYAVDVHRCIAGQAKRRLSGIGSEIILNPFFFGRLRSR